MTISEHLPGAWPKLQEIWEAMEPGDKVDTKDMAELLLDALKVDASPETQIYARGLAARWLGQRSNQKAHGITVIEGGAEAKRGRANLYVKEPPQRSLKEAHASCPQPKPTIDLEALGEGVLLALKRKDSEITQLKAQLEELEKRYAQLEEGYHKAHSKIAQLNNQLVNAGKGRKTVSLSDLQNLVNGRDGG